MPVSGTSTDYTGRLKDINLSGKIKPNNPAIQNIGYTFGKPTQFIAGVQKLIQRYLITLINSGFAETLAGLGNSNIQTAKNTFNSYNADIVQQFRAYQNSQSSGFTDEQLNTVQLTALSSNGSTLSFSLNLITQAGSSVPVLLPLPLV